MGGIDILYNNAGEPKFGPIGEMSVEDYLFTVRNEMDQYFYAVTAAWPHLVKSGNAAIVSTGSISGIIGVRTLPQTAHAMTKAGIIGMTHQLAAEGARLGIRANTVSPGLIYTPATSPFVDLGDKGPLATFLDQLPMGRPGRPDEIVNAALFLASDEASYITGQNLVVDGGATTMK
jgi:NAD(P)-dependent dehydrogenase (short-subunit alcohol dehydrogenase family)